MTSIPEKQQKDQGQAVAEFEQFRQALYEHFNKRADTAFELVDALCAYPEATSPVELSLAPEFRRTYTALYKALAEVEWEHIPLAQLVAPVLARPQRRRYWLLSVDVTPQPRPYAPTLSDRGYVYQPNTVAGNKPVVVGHQYSTVVLHPEPEPGVAPVWVVPVSVQRVATTADKELCGAAQITTLLDTTELPWQEDLVVLTGDTSYSKPAFLYAQGQHPNVVTIARARSNRTFYTQYVYPPEESAPAHRPRRYGDVFKLPDPTTWHAPDAETQFQYTRRNGKQYTVKMQGWDNMVMRGKNKPTRLPMADCPFTLVRVQLYREDGTPVYARPLWLIVAGARRAELTLADIFAAYTVRFDIEHFFRFSKQHLLLTAYQTPNTERETRWWYLAHLAYVLLWVARHLAQRLPRPWERYLPTATQRQITPAQVQRDFARLIQQLGTPARPPQPRGKSPGRAPGTQMPPRPRPKVVYKGAA